MRTRINVHKAFYCLPQRKVRITAQMTAFIYYYFEIPQKVTNVILFIH